MPRTRSGTASSVSSMQNIPGGYPSEADISQPVVSSQQSLAQAVHARRAEYTRPHTIRLKVGSWNVAAKKGTDEGIGGWFVGGKGISQALTGLRLDESPSSVDSNAGEGVREQEARRSKKESTLPRFDPGQVAGGKEVGIYALGLQEVVDISSATEALRPYADTSTAKKWKMKVEEALPSGYKLVAEEQLIGLLLLVWASPEVAPHVRSVSTTSVGTGLAGYLGNKGASTARIVLGETTRLVFIDSHMSAGVGKSELQRRNWDAAQIMSRTKFDPVVDSLGSSAGHSEKIGDEDFAFWFGDLNYRLTGIPGEDVRRLLLLHTRNEYDVGQLPERKIDKEISEAPNAVAVHRESREHAHSESTTSTDSNSITSIGADSHRTSTTSMNTLHELDNVEGSSLDPTSLQTTLDSLLTHDELHEQQRSGKMFQDGWREGPITFVPTYKYDVGSVGLFDSGEKRRAPSWCDRILYRTRRDRLAYEERIRDAAEARKRDAHLKAEGLDKAAEDEDTLFDYDPEADGDDANDNEEDTNINPTGSAPLTMITKDGYEDTIALESYVSHQRVLSSDHKPLSSVFSLKYDAVIPELRSQVHELVAKELDKAENDGRPIVTVVIDGSQGHVSPDVDGVNFGDVSYDEHLVRSVTVANTGKVEAYFGLAEQPSAEDVKSPSTPDWLQARILLPGTDGDDGPKEVLSKSKSTTEWEQQVLRTFLLMPGDTCTIELSVDIKTMDLVKNLNRGQHLEDILVLRVRGGKDHFIPVRGSWRHSIYGQTIDRLAQLPEGGIRAHQESNSGAAEDSTDPTKSAATRSAPVEIFRLAEAIESFVERIVAESNMLSPVNEEQARPPWLAFAGWPFVLESWTTPQDQRHELRHRVVGALESGQLLNTAWPDETSQTTRVEVLAETLLTLLQSLEGRVITEELWLQLEQQFFTKDRKRDDFDLDDQRSAVLETIASSKSRSVSFVIITSMLARMIQEIAGPPMGTPATENSPVELPTSPVAVIRRRTLDRNPKTAVRQLFEKNYAAIFADAMIQTPSSAGSKAKRAIDDQKRELVEIFLTTGG
ncbi:MAG: hypothetical protein M1828_003997 [Chrysothrix sp. TS-e1954]|nr:MAG: hypothetical protein M1828_003997 [Chrysothrix sp. TS-e1954]